MKIPAAESLDQTVVCEVQPGMMYPSEEGSSGQSQMLRNQCGSQRGVVDELELVAAAVQFDPLDVFAAESV